jgi:hypothetical protein
MMANARSGLPSSQSRRAVMFSDGAVKTKTLDNKKYDDKKLQNVMLRTLGT